MAGEKGWFDRNRQGLGPNSDSASESTPPAETQQTQAPKPESGSASGAESPQEPAPAAPKAAEETQVIPAVSTPPRGEWYKDDDGDTDLNGDDKTKTKVPIKRIGLIVGGIVVLLVIISVGAKTVATMAGSEQTAEAPVSSTSVTPSKTATPSDVKELPKPERCPGQAAAGFTTPEGAVVAFNQAYFDGNIQGIKDATVPGSYLQNVDYGTVLDGLIGSEWCAKTEGNGPNSVNSDVTVVTPDGKELLYQQTYILENLDGQFKISRVEDR